MPANPFSVDVDLEGTVARIRLHGDVTMTADDDLGIAYRRVASSGATAVVLDFSDVDYINSTGIAVIVGLLADARRDAREVRAAGLSPHYVEIFEITRLSDYVRMFDDAESAMAAGSPPPVAASGGEVTSSAQAGGG